MKTDWISNEINSNFVCFPVDEINRKSSNFSLTSFYVFLEETTDLRLADIQTVCNCIRYWIAKHKSFYVDKNSNILVRLHLKDDRGNNE